MAQLWGVGVGNVALGLVPSQKQASGQPVARFSSSYVAFTRPYVIPAEAGIHRRRGQRNHSSYSKSLRMLYRPAVHHIRRLRLLLDYTFCIGPARPCPAHRTTHYFAETHPSDEIASS